MPDQKQSLINLTSVGPAAVEDFRLLGIKTVSDLIGRDANDLYQRLCEITGKRHDLCVKDVFSAAVAQAHDPDLPSAQKSWSYWSRKRKINDKIS